MANQQCQCNSIYCDNGHNTFDKGVNRLPCPNVASVETKSTEMATVCKGCADYVPNQLLKKRIAGERLLASRRPRYQVVISQWRDLSVDLRQARQEFPELSDSVALSSYLKRLLGPAITVLPKPEGNTGELEVVIYSKLFSR